MLLLILPRIQASLIGFTDSGTSTDPDEITHATGTVAQFSTDFILVNADNPISSYRVYTVYPLDLPEAFRRDKIRVRFSGKMEVNPEVDYLYPPLRISIIEQILP